jgi:hypothetical protein
MLHMIKYNGDSMTSTYGLITNYKETKENQPHA